MLPYTDLFTILYAAACPGVACARAVQLYVSLRLLTLAAAWFTLCWLADGFETTSLAFAGLKYK